MTDMRQASAILAESPVVAGHVTEMEFAAYSKEDLSEEVQRKIIKRLFNALDPLNANSIQESHLDVLLTRLGDAVSEEAHNTLRTRLFPTGTKSCTFDKFYDAWKGLNLCENTARQFALVSGNFKDPYQQQQLFIQEAGDKFTSDYRVAFYFNNLETGEITHVSPWHDIPLMVKDIVRTTPATREDNRYNFICEIPKWTRAKFEVATKEPFNPIKQDIKNGMPRFYKHGDMLFNYGCLPQTWESPEHQWPGTNANGDNDPMDAIEIGMTQLGTGSVTQVKVLGILGMIDSGEMDWKVVVISIADPISHFLQDISDVPKYLPGALEALREWLRVYKICQGGQPNEFAFAGEYKDKAFAKKVIHESYLMWCNLHKIRGSKMALS
jgi:inorganic pyrophosphatase